METTINTKGGAQTGPLRIVVTPPQRSSFDGSTQVDAYECRPPYLSDKRAQCKERNDLAAIRDELIIEHIPMVRVIAGRIHGRLPAHVLLDDLYSAGLLGLIEAVDRFDPSKKVLFRTYAQCRIRGAILDSLRSLDWSPRRLRSKGRAIEQAIQKLAAQFQRPPEEEEIAEELNIRLTCYQQLLGSLKGLEIDTLYAAGPGDSIEEKVVYVRAEFEDDPLIRCLDAEVRVLLALAVAGLPDRERMVVSLRYYEELTVKEIGFVLGVTEARVSQICSSAILHLRASLMDAGNYRQSRLKVVPDAASKDQGSRKTCASTVAPI
jgi:RNA polymerase sigma factor for flagellar operon FliA